MARCNRYAAGARCDARKEAQSVGEMFYSTKHGGWIFPADDRRPPKVLRDRWQAPYTWRFCPFCGGTLPDELSAAQQATQDEDDGN